MAFRGQYRFVMNGADGDDGNGVGGGRPGFGGSGPDFGGGSGPGGSAPGRPGGGDEFDVVPAGRPGSGSTALLSDVKSKYILLFLGGNGITGF